jgi:PAS domain S-box-containing protein
VKVDVHGEKPRDFQHLLMQLAVDLVGTPCERIDQGLARALAATAGFLGADRARLMIYDFDQRTVETLCLWCAGDIAPAPPDTRTCPMTRLGPDWIGLHQRGEIVHLPDVKSLAGDNPLRGRLTRESVAALAAVPLVHDGRCHGCLEFQNITQSGTWRASRIPRVAMLAGILAKAVSSRREACGIRKSAQRTEANGRLMRKTIEATGAAIWELDRKSPLIHMVSGWRRLTGMDWDAEWIRVDEFLERVHPEDRQTLEQAVHASRAEPGDSFTAEFRIRHASGAWLPLRAWWLAEQGRDPAEIHLSGGVLDNSATIRTRTTELRRASMERCLSRISARFVDPDSFDSSVKAALQDIGLFSGACRADFFLLDHSRRVMDNIHEWCDNRVASRISESQGIPLDIEPAVFARLAAGEVIAIPDVMAMSGDLPAKALLLSQGIRALASAPMLVAGRLEGFIGVESTRARHSWSHADLELLRTCAEVFAGALSRTRAEASLVNSERLHRGILNALNEIVLLADENDRITFVNQAWTTVTGRPADAAIGMRLADLLDPRDASAGNHRREPAEPHHEGKRIIVRIAAADGGTLHLSAFRRPMADGNDHSAATLVTLIDVTAQHRWEEKLVAARIEAEGANEAKTLYLSKISHELRTPMQGVLGMLELMLESDALDTRLAGQARDAHTSAKALLRLLDGILDMVRIEHGGIQLSASHIKLRPMIENVMRTFEKDARSAKLWLKTEIADTLPETIICDELRLRQIIGNLVSNAIKFTDKGGVSVSVDRCALPREKGRPLEDALSITVADTGIGIADQDIPSLFHPFVQLDSARLRKTGGSGLGLAIVNEITRLLGGRLRLKSTPGAGTRVKVMIPLGTRPPEQDQGNEPPEPAATTATARIRVLVADDDKISRSIARERLESLGCLVTTVPDGRQAVAACAAAAFDVVLMDNAMPVLDGCEATVEILKHHAGGTPPAVIGCTANASQEAAARCLSAGMRAVMVKPYSREDLLRTLATHAASAQARDARNPHSNPPQTAIPAGIPVVDPQVIQALNSQFSDNSQASTRLLELFHTDVARRIAELSHAMSRGDLGSSASIAHSLKGSAASIGAQRLATLCDRIETAALAAQDDHQWRAAAASNGLALACEYAAADDALQTHFGHTPMTHDVSRMQNLHH